VSRRSGAWADVPLAARGYGWQATRLLFSIPIPMTTDHHPLVLVVDDDLDTRELYRMVLESAGYRVEDAGQMNSALAVAARVRPDVVLTDWLLPDGDGFEVCRSLRANRLTCRVPVIAVTGVSLDDGAETNGRLDCFAAILRKPADPDDILAAIAAALTRAAERSRQAGT
jgi:DNA-binding response OmpR family regulator